MDWKCEYFYKANNINNKGENRGFCFFETGFAARNFCP